MIEKDQRKSQLLLLMESKEWRVCMRRRYGDQVRGEQSDLARLIIKTVYEAEDVRIGDGENRKERKW